MEELYNSSKDDEKDELMDLETALEMRYRGFSFRPTSIEKSEASEYVLLLEEKALLAPLTAIKSLGPKVAENIVSERKIAPFVSLDDFKKRTKVDKTALEHLKKIGALKNFNHEKMFGLEEFLDLY
jgi:DNA polymerase-3 subunit alpha (Gram-positive type)